MPRKKKKWLERRPIPACHVGVLHAFGPGFLHAPNRTLEFCGKPDRRIRVPLKALQMVCIYGSVRVTSGAVRVITSVDAGLVYLSANGGSVTGVLHPSSDQWKGRRYRQFHGCSNREWRLGLAQEIVSNKISSVLTAARYEQQQGRLIDRHIVARLTQWMRAAKAAPNHDTLRGIEGSAARLWFSLLGSLLPEHWSFSGRRKRPPTDPVNALLSLGYTVLFHRVEAACRAWGVDPALGVFHEYRPGRSSLACDLMEAFRVPVIDRLVLSLLRQSQLKLTDFVVDERDNSVQMTEDGFRRYLRFLEEWMHDGESSSQSQIFATVQNFCATLPEWDHGWLVQTEGREILDGVEDSDGDF